MTLDGVVQSHGGAEEDPSSGFGHGGWHMPYFDATSWAWQVEHLSSAGALLLGRRTYDIFARYWPTAPAEEHDLADVLNSLRKYVASTTLTAPLQWHNAMLLPGPALCAIRELKKSAGGDLHVLGSAELVGHLVQHDLVDVYRLMIDPVLVGGGKRIFRDDATLRRLNLDSAKTVPSGAIIATYTAR